MTSMGVMSLSRAQGWSGGIGTEDLARFSWTRGTLGECVGSGNCVVGGGTPEEEEGA
jgi:hypothetical protein